MYNIDIMYASKQAQSSKYKQNVIVHCAVCARKTRPISAVKNKI